MATYYDFVSVDVFTDTPYEGNPLPIVKVPRASSLTQERKQTIAREFNTSETVFLHDDVESPDGRRVDIFTVDRELPFAGHPTIGSLCFIAMEAGSEAPENMKLKLKAGPVLAKFDRQTLFAEAQIPSKFHIHSRKMGRDTVLATQPELAKVLSKPDGAVEYDVASIVSGMNFVMARLSSVDELGAVKSPNTEFEKYESYLDEGWNTDFIGAYYFVQLSSSEEGVTKLRTRMMSPMVGEDPATGAAACTLACYLATKSGAGQGMHTFKIEQGVEMGRRSLIQVRVEMEAEAKVKRVLLSGRVVKVQEGKILA